MTRNEEYRVMLEELEQEPAALAYTIERAVNKRKKRTLATIRPIAGVAACFVAFVLLVNYSAPIAYACSRIPLLKELAAAVTFSRSLTDAVENEYVQPISLSKTENDITASVEYLIVDQKQVNVFYRLTSEKYSCLNADPGLLNANGKSPLVYSNGLAQENGELCSITFDFIDEDVPEDLQIMLRVFSNEIRDEAIPPEKASNGIYEDVPDQPEYLAELEFLLEFDPLFTAAGKEYQVNQAVELDGQKFTITDVLVYPTHMRVNIDEDEDNTAWLKNIDFYIELDLDTRFDPVSNGITATGSSEDDSKSMVSYRADSTYFYDAKHLRLVITGATLLNMDSEKWHLNLLTGESDPVPTGSEFISAERGHNGWVVTFETQYQENKPMTHLFGNTFYDEEGNSYEINMWSSSESQWNEERECTHYHDSFPLKDYPYNEVWLSPLYTHMWEAEKPIVISIA